MFRKSLVKRHVRRRFAVMLSGGEGVFSGVLTELDREVFVFDQCQTVPKTPDATPDPFAGRFFVDRENVVYLQELSSA